jgi:hypothetical protein
LFEVAKITYNWAIECTLKLSFEQLFKLAKIIYIYWKIECTPEPSFVKVFELARITYIY